MPRPPRPTRRSFLSAVGVGGAAALAGTTLSACGGSSGSSEGSGDSLTMVLWGADAELAAFTKIADAYKAKTGTTVKLQVQPYSQITSKVDSLLQSNNAPDLFRVSYTDIGRYTGVNALADISSALPSGFADSFTPGLWKAVQADGKPVGVPHHTDVTAVLYNQDSFSAAGITDVPTTLDTAWTWDEWTQVLEQVKGAKLPGYPTGVNWQAAGAFRWLSFLAQAGGSVYGEKGPGPDDVTIASEAGLKAMTYTQGLYTKGLHDPSLLVQAASFPDDVFPSGKLATIYAGDFLLPALSGSVKDFEFGATFLPRDVDAATDLGGNAVVVPNNAPNAEKAADFAVFLASKQNMIDFCQATTVLPTRSDVQATELEYAVRPDLMPVFVEQATTIPETLVETCTSSTFSGVNQALQQQLEKCFSSGQSPKATLEALQSDIEKLKA